MVKDIFERLKSGEAVRFNDPQYRKIFKASARTIQRSKKLNAATDITEIRKLLSDIIEYQIDNSTTIFTPFHTNFGRFIRLGKEVFINHDCTFLDLGGITIEDEVLIGPKVKLITESHPLKPSERKSLIVKPILIKKNVWIGAGATILPGVTVGVNSVVAANALVSKDVPENTVVAGIPAKVVKELPY
ncbi:sugar O-acetyltransferase [Pareuzebyella sediminis]|uniref:sugar O-acetyltransferase n=1 Tax=Pareuzebyella sediminis TaxID=2607998 RepID=UPI0011EE03F3|nr:sugar O-acetyltransferase [Pareuzebyella sediminis]